MEKRNNTMRGKQSWKSASETRGAIQTVTIRTNRTDLNTEQVYVAYK
jgi:hypothetical protein